MSQWYRKRRGWKLALKICGSALFGLTLLEIGLRVTGTCPRAAPPEAELKRLPVEALVARAAQESWIHQPSAETVLERAGNRPDILVKRNWCGCREDQETPLAKPPGVQRIVVLGDSHTDGFVLNQDSYANILEQTLGARYDVVNCGQAVSSPYQHLWIYRLLYHRFDPDVLLVGFYAGNDLFELMLRDDRIHLEWNGSDYVHAEPGWRPDLRRERSALTATLSDHVAIFRAAAQLHWLHLERQRQRRAAAYYRPLIDANNRYPAATWQGLNQAYYFKHHPEDWDVASDMLAHVLNEFKNIAPRDGLRLVIIPSARQLRPDVAVGAADILQLTPDECACDERVCDLVIDICQRLQIPALDLRPVFKGFSGELYWDSDHHINRAAHRLIAEELTRQLPRPAIGAQ